MIAKKVLYVCPNAKRAGAEQLTMLFARYHDRSRWEPQIYFFSDGPLVEEMRALGVKCHLHPGRRWALRLRNVLSIADEVLFIRRIIRSEHIDLVHSVMGYGHVFGGLAAWISGVPEVWYQHGPTGSLDWLTGRIPSRAILTNSDFTASQQARYRAWAGQVQRIYPGVECLHAEDWAEPAARIRNGLSPGAIVFALVGRIAPMKGHLLFVEAAANLMNRFSSNTPSVEFLIVGNPFMPGDQNYFDELKVRIAALGLRDRFHFTGHLSPPYSAMAAADIVVNCSVVPEPFGLTLIEAMMLGRPVIAPAAGGPLEIIEPDVSGILFRPGDSQGLADAMGALMDKETRLRLSEQGKAHALKKFEVRKMVQDLEAGYSKIF